MAPPRIEYRTVDLTWLNPAGYNPRIMTDEARRRLRRGIEEYGIVDPFIARAEDGLLVGGHQRLVVARAMGLTTGPCIVVHELSDERAKVLNVLLNNPNAQGQWDMPRLTELLSDLDANGADATLTGFDEEELAKLLAPVGEPDLSGLEPEEDRYAEQYGVIVVCPSATEQEQVYEELQALLGPRGLEVKVVVT